MFQQHWDDEGKPAGGVTSGRGFAISWQNGPLGRGKSRLEPNGAFVEEIIKAAIGRIEHYQAGPYVCQTNANALHHLELAVKELNARTADREERQVEGTHEK